MIHTGDISGKIEEAKNTLLLADEYMSALGKEFENLRGIRLSEKQVMDYIEILLPLDENFTQQQKRGIERLREDMRMRYFDAPDLKEVGNNGYRFINVYLILQPIPPQEERLQITKRISLPEPQTEIR